MRITFLSPLLLFLLSFTSNPISKKEVLYKCKKGTLSIEKDFIKVDLIQIIIEEVKVITLKYWYYWIERNIWVRLMNQNIT